jgi:hypothetical protein
MLVYGERRSVLSTSVRPKHVRQSLIDAAFSVWVPELYPHRSSTLQKQAYFEQVMTDGLLMSVNLAAAFARTGFATADDKDSATLGKAKPGLVEKYWLRYKGVTLQMLIDGMKSFTYSNLHLFTAVTTMAGCAFLVNNPNEGRLHLGASAQIARGNGGFGTIPSLLLEIFLLDEGLLASLSGSHPVVSYSELAPVVHFRLPKVPDFAKSSSSQLCKLFHQKWPSRNSCSLVDTMADLHAATEILNAYSSPGVEDQLRDTIVLRMFLAGFCLCWSLEVALPTHEDADCHTISMECIRLSGLLLIHTTHLKGTPKQHLYDRVATDLLERLQQLNTIAESPQTVAWMEIWVSFLGAHASVGTKRKTFFLNRISKTSEMLGLRDWVEIKMWLKRFPYIDKEFDGPFRQIWTQGSSYNAQAKSHDQSKS